MINPSCWDRFISCLCPCTCEKTSHTVNSMPDPNPTQIQDPIRDSVPSVHSVLDPEPHKTDIKTIQVQHNRFASTEVVSIKTMLREKESN